MRLARSDTRPSSHRHAPRKYRYSDARHSGIVCWSNPSASLSSPRSARISATLSFATAASTLLPILSASAPPRS